jgi:hypothetical protein
MCGRPEEIGSSEAVCGGSLVLSDKFEEHPFASIVRRVDAEMTSKKRKQTEGVETISSSLYVRSATKKLVPLSSSLKVSANRELFDQGLEGGGSVLNGTVFVLHRLFGLEVSFAVPQSPCPRTKLWPSLMISPSPSLTYKRRQGS